MRVAGQQRTTEDEYLEAEASALDKHEWLGGQVYAMAGGSPEHHHVCARLIMALGSRLRGRCSALTSDQRIHVPETGLYTYPDVTVVCGRAERLEGRPSVVVNPCLLAEVLSAETEAYDRGEKFAHCRRIRSLEGVLFVAIPERRLELHHRRPDGVWELTEARGEEATLRVAGLGIDLPLAEVFEDLQLVASLVP